MLSKYDDMALHQTPTTFDHPVSSDPRWFEHQYFLLTARDGSVGIATGVRVYLNADVVEAFGCVTHRGKQYNVRASRRLRPNLDKEAGPVRVECIEGLRRFGLVLGESDIPVQFDLTWESSGPAWEEPHHYRRHEGRVAEDYLRFDQVGSFAGHVMVEGKRIELRHEDTFAARDHSWGVRTLIGGDQHGATGSLVSQGGAAHWMLFDVEGAGQGYVASREDADGNVLRCEGYLGSRFGVERSARRITGFRHQLRFPSGSRRIRDGHVQLTASDGERLELDLEAISEPLNEHGAGNQRGFADGLGYGVRRAELLVEGDIWDQSDPAKVVNLGPTTTVPNSRLFDNVVRLRAGDREGYAIYVFFAAGAYQPYRFEG